MANRTRRTTFGKSWPNRTFFEDMNSTGGNPPTFQVSAEIAFDNSAAGKKAFHELYKLLDDDFAVVTDAPSMTRRLNKAYLMCHPPLSRRNKLHTDIITLGFLAHAEQWGLKDWTPPRAVKRKKK